MTAENTILEEAKKLGFDSVGFVRAGPSDTMECFNRWLETGNAGSMDFLRKNRALRSDIRKVEPAARSVIVVAARYPENPNPGVGISFLARGRDYHAVMKQKLIELARSVAQIIPITIARPFADATPLPERELAVKAGIGWRGRQGQIVNATGGACLILGELLVDTDLPPSAPIRPACGDCRLCLDACPTHAINDDGLVDARRCISYLTIEHKEEFSAETAQFIGASLFGCDRCTAICPLNRKATTPVMPDLEPLQSPSPEEILRMTNSDFKKRFAGTSILRVGLARLRRNAKAVLHNAGCLLT